jgi:hypothetical protein
MIFEQPEINNLLPVSVGLWPQAELKTGFELYTYGVHGLLHIMGHGIHTENMK